MSNLEKVDIYDYQYGTLLAQHLRANLNWILDEDYLRLDHAFVVAS
jgi:hypothetical protein